jgi:hypothetical protein
MKLRHQDDLFSPKNPSAPRLPEATRRAAQGSLRQILLEALAMAPEHADQEAEDNDG